MNAFDDDNEPPRTFWQRLPKKTLFKAFWLAMMLVGVFIFQGRTASCARVMTDSLIPPPPAVKPATTNPPAAGRTEHVRTVRLAPFVPPDAGN